MKCQCPKCGAEFEVEASAVIPKEQSLTAVLKLSSEMISAKTLGEFISNFAVLQGAVAREAGVKNLHTFVKGISLEDSTVEVEFFMTILKPEKKGPAAAEAV